MRGACSAIVIALWSSSALAEPPPAADVHFVHIGGTRRLTLERQHVEGHDEYAPVCVSPCDADLAAGHYRLTGERVRPSATVVIGGARQLVLEPHMGLSSLRTAGVVLASVGSTMVIGGGVLSLLPSPNEGGLIPSLLGWMVAGVGAALFLGAIPFFLASASSVDVVSPAAAHVRFTPNGMAF